MPNMSQNRQFPNIFEKEAGCIVPRFDLNKKNPILKHIQVDLLSLFHQKDFNEHSNYSKIYTEEAHGANVSLPQCFCV